MAKARNPLLAFDSDVSYLFGLLETNQLVAFLNFPAALHKEGVNYNLMVSVCNALRSNTMGGSLTLCHASTWHCALLQGGNSYDLFAAERIRWPFGTNFCSVHITALFEGLTASRIPCVKAASLTSGQPYLR